MPSFKVKLAQLAREHQLGRITYEIKTLQSGNYIGVVKLIGGQDFPLRSFQCYPSEFETAEEAEEECARLAAEFYVSYVEQRSLGKTRVQLPETMDLSLIVKRVLEIVKAHATGCWSPAVVVKYSRVHAERLPVDWVKKIQQATGILQFEPVAGHFLVRFRDTASPTECNSVGTPEGSTSLIGKFQKMNIEMETWLVHVLSINPKNRLAVRRVDTKIYDEWEAVVNDMERYCIRNLKQLTAVERPVSDRLYTTQIEGVWLRIKILNNQQNGKVEVALIDFADKEEVELKDIYELPERFAKVPPQGLEIELEGLSDLPAPLTQAIIQIQVDHLLNKVFIARVTPAGAILYESSERGERNMNRWILAKAAPALFLKKKNLPV